MGKGKEGREGKNKRFKRPYDESGTLANWGKR